MCCRTAQPTSRQPAMAHLLLLASRTPTPRRPTAARRALMTVLAWGRSAVGLLVLIAVVDYVVLPRMAGSEQSLRLLRHVGPWWVGAAIMLEATSLVSYSLSTRSV